MLISDIDLLMHIKTEVDFVLNATNNKSEDVVFNDEILSRAVVRSLEIIGEATKKLNADFKAQHPHIEWKKMAGTRDKLIHDYFGVDYEIVWDVIENKLPELQFQIDELLKEINNK
jgi:uncharacterized protein with HEPN domain